LCEKGHINELCETINEFYELYKEANRIISAEVISAAELSDEQKQRLEEKLEKLYKCKVQITYSLDKSLLGGVTVKVAGKVLDQSLKHRLKSIKEVINQ
jgi:F-type H+-transporting ATPase subunit delta